MDELTAGVSGRPRAVSVCQRVVAMDVIRLTIKEIGTRANYTANGGRMASVCCSRFEQLRSGCHDVNADLEHRRRWCGIEVLGGGRDQRGFVSSGPSQGRLGGGDGREHDGAAHFALASMTILLLKSERPLCNGQLCCC